MPLVLQILLPIAVGVVCAVIAFIAGSNHRKHTAEAEIGSAEQERSVLSMKPSRQRRLRKRKRSWRERTRFTASVWRRNGKSPTAARMCSARNAESSRKKKLWIKSWSI